MVIVDLVLVVVRRFGLRVVLWIIAFVLGGALCIGVLKGCNLRRVEKWGESVGGSIGYEVWGKVGCFVFFCFAVWC